MRRTNLLLIPAILLFANVAVSQISQGNYLPYKELIFPQVAAGGQYQTWVTVTNPGTQPWSGTFNFYTTQTTQGVAQSVPWNPLVNGSPISGGSLAVQIASKATSTYKITLTGSTQSGYLIATTSNTSLDNFLEGNLTYYVGSTSNILDAVGVLPSNPISATTIPFEDFSTIAIGFANAKAQGKTATITLKLFTDKNVQTGTTATVSLTAGAQVAEYLRDAFPTASNTSWRGRVDIESTVPVGMIALSQTAGGQYASLPLDSTTQTFSITTTSPEMPSLQMTLWSNGLFINGYASITGQSGLYAVCGQTNSDGTVRLYLDAKVTVYGYIYDISIHMKTNEPYMPATTTYTGTYSAVIWSLNITETGTFTAMPPVSPYDGSWTGSTSQNLALSMTIANNAITVYSFGVNFPGLGPNCPSGVTVSSTSTAAPIPLSGNSFTYTSSSGTWSGTFQSATSGTGTLIWKLSLPGCSATSTVNWNATKH